MMDWMANNEDLTIALGFMQHTPAGKSPTISKGQFNNLLTPEAAGQHIDALHQHLPVFRNIAFTQLDSPALLAMFDGD